MTEKIISELKLDLVFKCNEFSQFSNKLKDSKNKLIFESIFWEKVFLSWIKIILKKDYQGLIMRFQYQINLILY